MIELNVTNLVGGSISVVTTPPISPSPYFAYDSNRVITGLYQGSPNIHVEGTYVDRYDQEYAEEHDGEYPEKPYSGWTYGGSNVVENYAIAIGDYVFEDSGYGIEGIPPSRAITGSITFQNVTSIGDNAFKINRGLTNITMPNVTSIGTEVFNSCNSLTSVTIGSEIQRIGEQAFATYGENPITLTIGKTVAEVQAMGQTEYTYTNTPYSEWGLPSGSTIVCTDGTITI